MNARVLGWWLLVSGLLAIAGAYLLMGGSETNQAPAVLMIFGVAGTLAGPLLLSTPGRAPSWPLVVAAMTVLVVVLSGFLLALSRPDELPTDRLMLGLPLRAAIVLLGVGLVPALVLPWSYARAVAKDRLDPDSIGEFVEACRAVRAAGRDP